MFEGQAVAGEGTVSMSRMVVRLCIRTSVSVSLASNMAVQAAAGEPVVSIAASSNGDLVECEAGAFGEFDDRQPGERVGVGALPPAVCAAGGSSPRR